MLGGLVLSLVGARALAAEARYRIAIPPKPYADALIELGVQSNVSIIGTSACGAGGSAGASGQLTLDQALGQLLAGAPCSYRILDPRTVRIAVAAPKRTTEPTRVANLVTELLVTATKRPASAGQLPASVSVISREQIALTGAGDVLQTGSQLSGVITTNLGPGRDKLILRGLSDGAFTGRARSAVGSYLDDAPVNYNAPDPDLRLVDVERIEVVRGPQGALYGSGSLSGVYRIVPRKPELTGFAFGTAAEAATTEGGAPSYEIEGYANLPFVKDVAAARLVAYREVQGGFVDNADLRLSNVNRSTREGGRAAIRLQPSEDWQVDLSVTSQRLRSNDTQYTTLPAAGPASAAAPQPQKRVREGHKNDFGEAALTIRGELGWATLRSSTALIDHAFSSQYDASEPLLLTQFGATDKDLGIYFERTRINMLVQDVVLRSPRTGPLSWLVGAYGLATIEKSPTSLDIQQATGLERVYTENRRDRVREAAVYGEAAYIFAPGWSAAVGGRLFTSDVKTSAHIDVMLPTSGPRDFAGTRRFEGFSPKLSLQYEFSSGDLVYGLISEGYRPGGFNSGGFLAIRTTRTSYAPDRLTNFELGLKSNLFDRHMVLRAAAFFDRWKDIQTDQYRPSGLPFTGNAGDADIEGLEAEASYAFDFGLSLQANALWSDSRIFNANPDFADQLIDSLPGVPKFSAGLLAVYARPLPHDLTLRLVGETGYIGRSAVSFDASRAAEMGQYARTRLSAEVAGKSWTASLFVTNPTGARGDTFAYGNPFSFGLVRQSTPQRPRTIGLRLAANY